jgi:hypothetical protein
MRENSKNPIYFFFAEAGVPRIQGTERLRCHRSHRDDKVGPAAATWPPLFWPSESQITPKNPNGFHTVEAA